MTNGRQVTPFGELLTLRDAKGQLFAESVVSPARMSHHAAPGVAIDLKETQDRFVVDAVVPGLKPDDVDLTIQDNVLLIRGETQQQPQGGATPAQYHVMERRYGRFSRAVSFPTTGSRSACAPPSGGVCQ